MNASSRGGRYKSKEENNQMESKNSSCQKQDRLSSLTHMTNRYTARTGRAFGAPTLDTFARGVAFGLLALAVAPFILTTPVHATDDNTVELTIGSDADLKPSAEDATLYKATTPVKVKTTKPYGFNVTIHADSADLVNTKDNSHRIEGMGKDSEGKLLGMNANSWGYRVDEAYNAIMEYVQNKFLHTPAGDEVSNVVIDTASKRDNAGCKRKDQCEVHVTFGAAIAPNSLAAGKYSTMVTYTATAKPAPKPVDWTNRAAKTSPSETCQAGNTNSSCLVTLDRNMIPVKYTGTTTNAQWTSVADPEAANSGWYDYANKQWANAITVKPEALSKYRGFSKVVDQADILGFWVYIPRYRYKVLRYSGSDPAVPAQNFTIEFENKHSAKAIPTANGTWATHPAFTFGSKELNGIWFAKFETTGDANQPTVLPNQYHISGYTVGINSRIGGFYTIAKSLGVNDSNNVGGDSISTTQNSHHLARFNSHMVNNNDWGAATYLSASKYGAGYNGVQINSQSEGYDINSSSSGNDTYGTTGCGPSSNGNTGTYSDGGTLGAQSACSSSDPQRAYNGTIGQLASTTNNPTGIYDMSGGGWEHVAASYNNDLSNSSTDYFSQSAHPPYVNNYNFTEPNNCTFATCGGQALYETNNGINKSDIAQWNGNYMYFVSSSYPSYPWFVRGGNYGNGSSAGLFFAYSGDGGAVHNDAFRVALAPL